MFGVLFRCIKFVLVRWNSSIPINGSKRADRYSYLKPLNLIASVRTETSLSRDVSFFLHFPKKVGT